MYVLMKTQNYTTFAYCINNNLFIVISELLFYCQILWFFRIIKVKFWFIYFNK